IGGGLGLSLLFLRIGVFESGMFEKTKHENISSGIKLLFTNKKLFLKYVYCVAIGLPVWFIIGIFVGRAPEIAKMLNINEPIQQSLCVSLCYTGLVFGDLCSGSISQLIRSRKKVLIIFYVLAITVLLTYVNAFAISSFWFYVLIFGLGFSVGFWAIFVTIASEQFGTNIRATSATTVPNLVRGSLIPIAMMFDFFRKSSDFWTATYLSATIVFAITIWAWFKMEETFGKDLDYTEN
ncbi:MAG: MFS transporter, partial [Cytophagales bacterium]